MGNFQIISQLEDALPVVKTFLKDRPDLVSVFMEIADYVRSLEPAAIVRYNADIIGLSKQDSHFYFYISPMGEICYIKIKNRDKRILDSEHMEEYKKYCAEAVSFVNSNDSCILNPPQNEPYAGASAKPIPESYALPSSKKPPVDFTEQNKILEEARDILCSFADSVISRELFGARAYKALRLSGIVTYGDLAGKTAQELLEIRNFGESALKETCKAVLKLVQNEKSEKAFNGISLKAVRAKTDLLLFIQEYRCLCANEESRKCAAKFFNNFCDIIIKIITDPTVVSERNGAILYSRVFEKRTLDDIGKEYYLSRERIRQIINRTKNRIKGKIAGLRLPDEYLNILAKSIYNVEERYYLDCLSFVRSTDSILWEFLSYAVAKRENINKLNAFLGTCEDIHPIGNPIDFNDIEQNTKNWDAYRKWSLEEPDLVLIIKEGDSFCAYDNSAEIISNILGYGVGYIGKNNTPITGGSNFKKIQYALETVGISYAVILGGELSMRYDGSKNMRHFVSLSDEEKKLLHIIDIMEKGIDPITGEILESENFLLSGSVRKILKIAKLSIIENQFRP